MSDHASRSPQFRPVSEYLVGTRTSNHRNHGQNPRVTLARLRLGNHVFLRTQASQTGSPPSSMCCPNVRRSRRGERAEHCPS